jgi:hypothetical protein
MSKAEEYIKAYTRGCSNELVGGGYHEWLTPENALAAVELAREEMKLTWQDIQRIVKIADQMVDEDRGKFMAMEDEDYYKEVLERYIGTNKE